MRAAITLVVTLIPALAFAQPEPEEAPPDEPVERACVPECRAGFVCDAGACISACNPVCEANEMCTATAACVSKCNPACDANQVCTADGACVSRCNPACAQGQTCGHDGECTGVATGLPGLPGPGGPADPGWARKAWILSLVTSIVIGGLTIGIVAADDETVGLALGIPATLLGGIAIPIVAAGGKSARRRGGVEGNPGLRIGGWILYGLALSDAVFLIGLAIGGSPAPSAVAGSVGLLGMASSTLLGTDARNSHLEATIKTGAVRPAVGVALDRDNDLTPTVGVQVSW